MIRFILNENTIDTGMPPGTTLLDFIRYHKYLTGTKIGCREGDCGACTVLVGSLMNADGDPEPVLRYRTMTSCLVALGNADGKHIVTIEGINVPNTLNPVQQLMADEGATQCGFCTPGFVVSLTGYCLNKTNNPVESLDGNICRCTGYKSIERAAQKVGELMEGDREKDSLQFIIDRHIVPAYFSDIKKRLLDIQKEKAVPVEADYPLMTRLGGGTDLYVQKQEELENESLHFLFDSGELKKIYKENDIGYIGPSVTVTDLKESGLIQNAFPLFPRYAKLISSTPIRNMATVAGNFVNASPIGDLTVFFLALDAEIRISNLQPTAEQNSRTLPLKKFYKGYKQLDMEPGEMISNIAFRLPGKNSYFNFEKVCKRTHLDIASVNTAIYLQQTDGIIDHVVISAGGVGPVPMVLEQTGAFLKNKKWEASLIPAAIEIMKTEISPISDVRGSKEYKTLLLGQLIKAHLLPLLK